MHQNYLLKTAPAFDFFKSCVLLNFFQSRVQRHLLKFIKAHFLNKKHLKKCFFYKNKKSNPNILLVDWSGVYIL